MENLFGRLAIFQTFTTRCDLTIRLSSIQEGSTPTPSDTRFYSETACCFWWVPNTYTKCHPFQRPHIRQSPRGYPHQDCRCPRRGKSPLKVTHLSENPFLIPPSSTQTAYKEGEYIVRQGAGGDTFFIISKGRVSPRHKSATNF